ncbi:MAG: ABC transporter ATP-binding protein, partial [Bacteroidota bacterium]
NDLDIETLQALEEFLENFKGCVLIVSHDRYFMDKLVDHVFAFEGNGLIKDFPGSYSEYREWKELEVTHGSIIEDSEKSTIGINEEVVVQEKSSATKKLSFKDKFELETLEKDIAGLEKEKLELEQKLMTETEHQKINDMSEKFSKINSLLEEKTFRWLELND